MVLRRFYKATIGKEPDPDWWHILDELGKSKDANLQPLYDHLNNIRRNFRNPTQHPDKIYDIEEVQDLFNLCIDVVDRMVPEIRKRQENG